MSTVSRYEWDAGNLGKCQKHGVAVSEIEHALNTDPFIVPDYQHSDDEDRLIAVGFNRSGRPVFVVFTIRLKDGQEIVRPLSARYMHRKEIERYERLWQQKGPEV